MANTIYNSAWGQNGTANSGSDFYNVNGNTTASGELTSVKIVGGAAIGVNSTSATRLSTMDGVAQGKPAAVQYLNNVSYRGVQGGCSAALLDTGYGAVVIGSSGGYVLYSGATEAATLAMLSFVAGNYVTVNASGNAVAPNSGLNLLYSTQKISAVDTTTTGLFYTNLPYRTIYNSQEVSLNVHTSTHTWNTMAKGQYIVQGYPTKIAGSNNTTLLGAANKGQLTRSINRVEAIRTNKLATAMRAGYYNKFTGKWTTAPTISSDMPYNADTGAAGTATTDDAVNVTASKPGELTYKTGRARPWTNYLDGVAYSAKTTW